MKKVIKKKVEKVVEPVVEVSQVTKIGKLEIDLGRGDLNLMRDKINEIIETYER